MFGTILEFFSELYNTCKEKGKTHLSFIIVLLACVGTTYYLQHDFEERIFKEIKVSIQDVDDEKKKAHIEGFSNSMDTYYLIKTSMREHREMIGCDYILLLEYHNGAENIATGYQFCKFDITMEARADNVQYIQIDEFRDESIFKYDVFMYRNVSRDRLSYFSMEELKTIDPHFHHKVETATTTKIQHVITAHIYFEGHKAGALLFLFSEPNVNKIDRLQVSNCTSEIEQILISQNKTK